MNLRTIIFPILTLLSIVFLYEMPYLALLSVTIIAVVWLYLLQRRRYVLAFLGGAIGGFISEAIAVAAGAWSYAVPNVLGLPLWLLVVWGLATLFIIDTWEHKTRSTQTQ